MTIIFYLLAIIAIIVEYENVTEPGLACEYSLLVKDKKPFEQKPPEFKLYMVMNLIYGLWSIVGLFTFQWFAFVPILLLSAIPKGRNKTWRVIDGIICLLLLFFIVVNKFNLHIHL